MGRNPICTVLSVLIGMVILGTAWPVVSPAAAASSGAGHDSTPAVAGGGTHEIVPDPRRPLIYQVGVGDSLFYLNASTGEYLDSVIVGPSATSIDLSADGNFLYVAVSGANHGPCRHRRPNRGSNNQSRLQPAERPAWTTRSALY